MELLDTLMRMAHNNTWANHRLYEAVARLDSEAYHAQRTGFFPSLHRTLVHILFVDRYYLDALEAGGQGLALWPEWERWEREATFEQVRASQRATDQRLSGHVAAQDTAGLDAVIAIQRQTWVQQEPRGDVLLHLFQHQIHHRGQAHAMLSGTPVKPPQLDEFYLSQELPLREADLRVLGLPLR